MDEEKCPSLLDTLDFLKLPDFKLIPEPQKKEINFLYKDSDTGSESNSSTLYTIPEEESVSEGSKMSGAGYNRLQDFEEEMDDFENVLDDNEYREGEEYVEIGDVEVGTKDQEYVEDQIDVEDQEEEENEEDEGTEEETNRNYTEDDESESLSDYNSELIEFDKINDFVENIKEFVEESNRKNKVKLVDKHPLTYDLIVNSDDKERVVLRKDLNRKKVKKIIEIIDYIVEENKK